MLWLSARIPARSKPHTTPSHLFLLFPLRLAVQLARVNNDLLAQGVQQGIQDDLQGSRIFHQHPFHAFTMHREFSNRPRPADINSATRHRNLSPARRAQCGPREGIVKPSGRHPVNHQFLDMVDAAGDLNARPARPCARSIAESSACPPSCFRRSGNGAGSRDRSSPQIAHRGVLK